MRDVHIVCDQDLVTIFVTVEQYQVINICGKIGAKQPVEHETKFVVCWSLQYRNAANVVVANALNRNGPCPLVGEREHFA